MRYIFSYMFYYIGELSWWFYQCNMNLSYKLQGKSDKGPWRVSKDLRQ